MRKVPVKPSPARENLSTAEKMAYLNILSKMRWTWFEADRKKMLAT